MRLYLSLGFLLSSLLLTQAATVTLVPTNAVWKYLDDGSDQGTAWRAPALDDSGWSNGIPELGFGDAADGRPETTVIRRTRGDNSTIITFYFRHHFTVTNINELSNLHIGLVRDDGAVVYINGFEAFRQNMPGGAILFDTTASGNPTQAEESTFFTNTVSSSMLVEGENVIAVEVHQVNTGSSDVSFNLRFAGDRSSGGNTPPSVSLTSPGNNASFAAPASVTITANATDTEAPVSQVEFFQNGSSLGVDTSSPFTTNWTGVAAGTYVLRAIARDAGGLSATSSVISITVTNPVGPVTLVSTGAVWKYLDNGSDQGTAWRGTTFNDTSWASGGAQLGYGDGDETTPVACGVNPCSGNTPGKYITTYFRRSFTVADPASFEDLTLRLLRDDGAVVYLNGNELFRDNMPAGAVTFQTLAVNAVGGGDETTFFTFPINPAALQAGNNVLAVEIHQNVDTSSDISFDLQLFGNASGVANPNPIVTITSPAGGASFPGPTNITIAGDVTVSNATVTLVEVFANGTKLGNAQVTPSGNGGTFSYAWNSVGAGSYVVEAVATDSSSRKGTSGPVSITVTGPPNQPPTVSINSPANNSTFKAPTNLNVQVTANDPDASGFVSRVEFYRSGSFVGQSTVAPFNFVWSNVLVGTFQLTAVAVDNASGRGTSGPISITFTSAAPTTLIAMSGPWKYLDDGSDQGTAWTALAYNDSSWSNGVAQLGFGDGDENPNGVIRRVYANNPSVQITTYYFRRQFTTPDPSAYTALTATYRRDDGLVAYLNGTEVFRSNIGSGAVNFQTFANNAGDDGNSFFTNTIPATLLNAGANVLAVEVHQNSPTSTDLSFDLELIGNTGAIVNKSPTVALNSPSNDSTYTEPATVSIAATAADSDGTVSKVEFYANGGKIGEDTVSPYNFVWGGVGIGTYNLTAIAMDNFGASATSAVVRVFVVPSTPPTIATQTPLPGTVNGLTQITVGFSEPVDGVDASDLLINGVPATSVTGSNATYTFQFPQPLDGPVRVEFATDPGIVDRESPPKPFDAGAAEATWQYTLVDNVAPTVVLTEPAAGAMLQSLTEIEVTFSEAVANIQASDLLINGVPATDLSGYGAGKYRFTFPQPPSGTVQVAWTNNHGIRDFSAGQNAFAGGSWTYTLNPNVVAGDIVINEIMFSPAPVSTATEYIELYNRGTNPVTLTGWRFSRGVDYTFPMRTLAPGAYLVVAANVAAFNAKYPGVANVIGGWQGVLSNGGEDIQLEDANGNNVDTVEYSDEGDWAVRIRSGTSGTGWDWLAEADGSGKSLELCNPAMPGNNGQNWRPSNGANGSPGVRNFHNTNNIAPLISEVIHSPAVPRPSDSIIFTAQVQDELPGAAVNLRYRDHSTTSPPNFGTAAMLDDGNHGDGAPGDGLYGVVLTPQLNGTIIEYYIEATDSGGRTRTWPAAARQADGTTFAQTCNALLQVSDEVYSGSQPFLQMIMTATELNFMVTLGRDRNRQFNATLIASERADIATRHNLSVRFRGASSFGRNPPTMRVNIPKDRTWHGASEYNLNSQYTYNQATGAAVAEKAGLAAAHVRPVQLRVNGVNWGVPGPSHPFNFGSANVTYGSYALQEVMNADWAARVFHGDSSGNVYRNARPDTGLDYLGTNPSSYIGQGYSKESNTSENDWSDLIRLTDVLNNSPDSSYLRDVRSVANIEQWMIYFAACQLMEYSETALCNGSDGQGVGDDYSMYRGINDPRFVLMAHDFDTIFGQGDTGGNPSENIFNMNAINTVARFITYPQITPVYYRTLKYLADTVYEPSQFDPFLDRVIGEFVPTTTIDAMKAFNVQRRNYVLSQIPLTLTINTGLPVVNGFFQTTASTVNLNGQANVTETYSVKVNGAFASWVPWQRAWSISGVALTPGLNTITVQTFDANGGELQRSPVVIWYDDGSVQNVSGTLAANTTWAATAGPFIVSGNLTVPAGVTLTIEAGTTIYFAQGASITVNGRLLAEGTDARHVRFTRQPGTANTWGGIRFNNTTSDNRLVYADIDFASTADPITAASSTVMLDHAVFTGTTRTMIDLSNSSAIIRNSVFPAVASDEAIHGTGMPANGYVIIEGNIFSGGSGVSDLINFTGGKRPGPILQVLNNTFSGGSDEAIDLNGADAHIEGNVFMNIHQDGIRDNTANAIAANGASDVTVARNVFVNNDHMLLLKNGSSAIVQNNTVSGIHTNGNARAVAAAINFVEAIPSGGTNGAGAVLEGNIFWDVDANRHFLNATPVVSLSVNYSLLGGTNHPGTGNLNVDPTFVSATDPRLLPGSPAIGAGPLSLDMGAYVPEGLTIIGEPTSPTGLNSATLSLYGPGITQYSYSLNGGAYGPFTPIATSISLSGLANGPNFVSVIARNSAGVSNTPVRSRIWVVRSGLPSIVINEVLARGDRIELYNPGSSAVSLAGWGITDEADNPYKYRFPIGSSIGAGQYLVLADTQVGFSIKREGDDISLTDPSGLTVDSITFGMQIDNYSIGRLANRQWALTVPTLGGPNRAARTGNPDTLKINEWLADGVSPFADDFIELFNPDPQPVALGGLFLTDSIAGTLDRHKITALSFITGGGFAVFIADGNAGAGADHVNFHLAAEGGNIGLYDTDLSLIDCVVYGPQTTDVSMGRQPNGSGNIVFFTTPTPGAPNPAIILPGTAIVINEILADNVTRAETDGSTPDWIELFNPTPSAVNLADMSLSDDLLDPRRFVFPSVTIPSGGYYVVRFEPDEPISATNTGFGLKASGGGVFLYDKLSNGGSELDVVFYGVQARDFSIGRFPSGSTNWVLTLPTRRAANIQQALGNPAALRVNEWMADPTSGNDWFEIYNGDALPVALAGLQLRDDGNIFVIPDLSFIGVGLFGFQRFDADGNTAAGADHVNFSLSRSRDSITIATAQGNLIDFYRWLVAQTTGVSEGRLPDGAATIVKFPTTPTPEASNYLPLTNVVINEVLAHSDLPFEDAIELRNLTGSTVDISGWYLSDAKSILRKFRMTNGTTIPPFGFKVFYETNFNNATNAFPFSFDSAHGDELYLSQATNNNLTGYRDVVKWGATENAVSVGRYQKSSGVDFTILNALTFGNDDPANVQQFRQGTGRTNALPKVGPIVITEVMYHPPDDPGGIDNILYEYIELKNISASDVPLYDPAYPTNTWQFRDGVNYAFPPNTTVPAGNTILVLSFDPVDDPEAYALFRSHYSLGTGLAMYGPYNGKLDNGGEELALYKPDAPEGPADPDAGFVAYVMVDRVVYDDLAPWPIAADGTGSSLHRVSLSGYGNDVTNWIAAAPSPSPSPLGGNPDRDGDGMPNDWELLYGFNPDSAADAAQDADGDGFTNLQEYLAGTDPLNALLIRINAGGPVTLSFNATANT
ncbi:MAG TPA: lamin tail domain-containing protein, partial [Verrucomicrobiae bacterium]|nr:lamin tail domain-containing protein [Verrucomicrobiae bacterium]